MSEALSNKDWADILVQALPYFKQYVGKTIVVKYGGNAMLNDDLKQAVMEDIVLLSTIGIRTVLVHGGGPEINAMLDKVGKESKFIGGLRYTDAETMEIVQMVLTGKLNKDIVGLLLQAGGKAVGLSGVDSGLLRAKKIPSRVVTGMVYANSLKGFGGHMWTEAYLKGRWVPLDATLAHGHGDAVHLKTGDSALEDSSALPVESFLPLIHTIGRTKLTVEKVEY